MVTDGGRIACDQVVLVAGTWTGQLASRLGAVLPIVPGKGYSLRPAEPDHPMRTGAVPASTAGPARS